MEKAWHPHKMTVEEVKALLRILPRAKTFIDLFGGSGIVSRYAIQSGKYKEVIYCDRRRFTDKIEGVEIFHCDYTDVLCFADKHSIVFADPPFFAMTNFDKMSTKDHLRIVDKLSEVDSEVYMLNSKELYSLAKNKIVKLTKWTFRQQDRELQGRVYLYKLRK